VATEVTEQQAREVAEAARETEWTRPSFAKELYLGRFDLSLIHPHPQQAHEDVERGEKFIAELRAYCETLDGTRIEREDRIPDEYIAGFNSLGAFGMKIPREYGGLALSTAYYGKALAMASSVHPAIGTLLSAHQSIGVPEPVKMFGNEQQKAEFLPRCAQGAISAFLLTEPDVGSDPARLAATATPTEDGSAYLLDGVKLWTTNGVIAELLVVMANVPKSEGHRGGITAFIVDAHSEGITVENRNRFMGLKGIENGVTRFHQVRVPAENRLGKEGQGLKIALTTLNIGRLSIPAICAGGGKWCLKIAREWSNERVQWGKPVGQHAAVAQKISFIAATTFGLESVLELSTQLADAGTKDIRIEAALAKLWASEMAWRIADELVQIRGGRGFETADSLRARGERAVPAEQVLRDTRINRIFEGSTEIMHLLIAREAVDKHIEVAGEILEGDGGLQEKAKVGVQAAKFYAKWLPQLAVGEGQKPGAFEEYGSLANHMRYVERASRKLACTTFATMTRYQAGLEKKQAVLGRIVDIGAELFAISSAVVYANTVAERHPERRDEVFELADVFSQQARRRVGDLFRGVWQNDDDANYKLATGVLKGRYSFIEEGLVDPAHKDDKPLVSGQPAGGASEETPAEASTNGGSTPVAAKVQ
jgi:alkylation response protein AidB-like acyl-CoA dehydrogenase